MVRLLVTGATGFVGTWTLRHWRKAHPEVEIWATSDQPYCPRALADRFSVLDLREGDAVREFIHACNPSQVIHLAGLVANAKLAEHLAINVLGTENIYNALSELDHFAGIRIVQAGTAAIYGLVAPEDLPVSEKNLLRPLTAYALSKATQDHLAEMFWRTRGLGIIRARLFNLLGPGQPDHLVPATFVHQLRARCDGGSLEVGNLAARRDFVDVRDAVRAFDRLLMGGRPGGVYNVASGVSVAVDDLLHELLGISGLQNVSVDEKPTRMRSNDVADVYADTTAIRQAVGWQPQISLRQSLEDMWKGEGAEDQPGE